jgi:DNA-binding transcriptional LysR family regulator
MADLDGETFPRWGEDCPSDGPLVRDSGQVMQLIALGRMVAVLPESITEHLRRDVVAVPVVDGATITLLLAWPEDSRSRALAAFVRTAVEVAGQTRVPDAWVEA